MFAMQAMTKSMMRFGDALEAIKISICAVCGNTSRKLQYNANFRKTGLNIDIDTAKADYCLFGFCSTTSLAVAEIDIIFGGLWFSFNV